MVSKVSVSGIYNCSLERAFKTPMLCDIRKVHTGYGFSPKVTHCTEDENWGKPGFSKKVFTAATFMHKAGWSSEDKVLEREENKYWKIEVSNFQNWMFGFTKFVGEWRTTKLEAGKILVEYTYTLHSNDFLLFPLNWFFANTFWRTYMARVLENIKVMAEGDEPYLFE